MARVCDTVGGGEGMCMVFWWGKIKEKALMTWCLLSNIRRDVTGMEWDSLDLCDSGSVLATNCLNTIMNHSVPLYADKRFTS
jgi:hypothetical protein